MSKGPIKFDDILRDKKAVKPPAYQWQDLALRVIDELNVPGPKRNSVFKVCKQYTKTQIEKALNDTEELAETGDRWKYFFKVLDNLTKQKIAEVDQRLQSKKSKPKAS